MRDGAAARLALALALAAAALAAAPAQAAVHLTEIATFDTPVYVTAPPADPQRLFIVEKGGRIMVVRGGQKLAAPFLDIRQSVTANGEQGLLSMAFAPDHATSRRFYVYYTAPGSGGGSVITVEEWRTRAGNPDAVDPSSRRVLVTIDHPSFSNHNGGQLQFGPDGALYAAPGDGGGTPLNAQDPGSRLGKLLRIDPATRAVEIWGSGLRNPWRFSFDRRTGDLVIADVGAGRREEVNFTPAGTGAGVNYGWNCWEGTRRNSTACDPAGDVFPVLEKDHGNTEFCAIVGGYVVRDSGVRDLAGRYVYGDNCTPEIRSAALVAPPARVTDDRDTGLRVAGLTSFGEDSCGHVYATSGAGPVFRIDGDAFRPCPAAGAGADGRAPRLRLRAPSPQRVTRRRGVRVAIRCDETCGAVLRGSVRVAGTRKRHGLRRATRQVAAGKRVRATVRFSKRTRRVVARALARGRRVRVRVTAVARDAAGNRSRAAVRTVRARR